MTHVQTFRYVDLSGWRNAKTTRTHMIEDNTLPNGRFIKELLVLCETQMNDQIESGLFGLLS